jgi:SAM-dependent methyltransferase
MGLVSSGRSRRAQRALERQLEFQRAKSRRLAGHEAELMRVMEADSRKVRSKIERWRPSAPADRVLEVGCGSHGLIFFYGAGEAVGVDPLADHYARLFPVWYGRARTVAAGGEALPFPDASFDTVLCENVVDHAESPRRILEETARVLRPGGILYFTVNVHHPLYHVAASAHAAWRALGVPFEITPFADHTVHLTPAAARRLFEGLPFRLLDERDNVEETRRLGRQVRPRHAGDRLKRLFYKNAEYEVIAQRLG